MQVVPLPATTRIDLPPIKVEGHYLDIYNELDTDMFRSRDHHHFLGISIDIGLLEENLTTDLLNHIIFFQKGFVKVNIIFNT